jgi:hypothetical protein
MKNIQTIFTQIIQITTIIATNFPDLSWSLDKNPMAIPSINHPHIDAKVMQEYLENLIQLLVDHIESHKATKELR